MFSSMRLAVARKRRQLTKRALAERASVSPDTVTRIESGGTSDPAEETVAALARALSYPVEFFYLDDCELLLTDSVSFRSLSSLTARQRDAALASGTIAFLLDDWAKTAEGAGVRWLDARRAIEFRGNAAMAESVAALARSGRRTRAETDDAVSSLRQEAVTFLALDPERAQETGLS